ncbi:MAG: protein Rep [Candidatus Moraniibacteriota bacterium]|nr:MAG: protein Rep [Candidatus Moranbacteria bacterium]
MHTSTGKYTEYITKRVFISGNEIEYYHYKEKGLLRNYKRKKRNEKKAQKEKESQKQKAQSTIQRTRKEIRRRVNANSQLIKFLTLTFKENETDIEKSNRVFNLFTQRMKDRFPEFQYLAVLEFQKRGAIHYHLLCNLRYIKKKELEKIWGQGFIDIKRIKHVSNLGRYICKYLQKDMFDERMFGKKKFFCSQNLKKPIELTNEFAQAFLSDSSLCLEKEWETQFENEYMGKVDYIIYRLFKA